jgi:hypothetical protein
VKPLAGIGVPGFAKVLDETGIAKLRDAQVIA